MGSLAKKKVKEAIGRGIGRAYWEFFRKEYVEKGKYDELFALWLLTHPKLRGTNAKCMGFECWSGKCEIKGRVIVALNDVKTQLLEHFKKAPNLILEGIEEELRETKPKNIYEKVEVEKEMRVIGENARKDIERLLKKEELSYYDEILDVDILDGVGYALDKVLGEGRTKEIFRKKVEENIELLTPNGKLAFLILSTDPVFVENRSVEGKLSEIYTAILRVITQESDLFVETFKEGIEELIIAGLLAGREYEKVVVPPFAVELWENAVENPVIVNGTPREIVEKACMIISWRERRDDRGKDQIL